MNNKNIKRKLSDVTVVAVSVVKSPANKKGLLFAKSEDGSSNVEFNTEFIGDINNPERILYGIVYEPDTVDSQGDFMDAASIKKSAEDYLAHYRAIDTEHNMLAGVGTVVQSYIAPQDLEIVGKSVKAGSWIMAVKVNDETWNQYVSGEITGFSMFGMARVVEEIEVKKSENIFKKAGNILANMFSKSVEDSMVQEINRIAKSPSFIIDAIENEFWKDYNWNDTETTKLDVLKTKLQEAISYIDALPMTITIMKNTGEENMENEEKVTTDVTTENPTPAETPENIDTTAILAKALEGIQSHLTKLDEALVAIAEKQAEIVQKSADTDNIIEEIKTSGVKTETTVIQKSSNEFAKDLAHAQKTGMLF